VVTRRIIASSGGFVSTPGLWGVMRPGGIVNEALRLTDKERPRVLLVMTASGDSSQYLATMYAALSDSSCDVDHLSLFTQPNRTPDEALGRADLVWVGGGSVANLLALWQLHGVSDAMRAAWERGAILAGVSAGSICWHTGGPTDSFGSELKAVTNGLGLLPYGNGVHYDSEEQRRPLLHQLVSNQTLPTSYATDDRIGILYEGTEAVRVLADTNAVDPVAGPAAYRVERVGGEVVETRLAVGPINEAAGFPGDR
jgi:peptidase E